MTARLAAAALLTALLLSPFVVNIVGWNAFLYVRAGSVDTVVAASQGLAHLALQRHYGAPLNDGVIVDSFMPPELDIETKTLIASKHVSVFAESRIDPLRPITFALHLDDPDYRSIEFPWLLTLLLPAALWAPLFQRKNPED